jgi:hypothetical protein
VILFWKIPPKFRSILLTYFLKIQPFPSRGSVT